MAAADKNRHTLYAYSFFKVIEEKCGEVKQNYNDFLEILVTDLFSELDKNNIDIYKIWSGDFFRRLVITKERLMNPNTKDETVSVFKAYKNYSQRYIQSYDKKEHLQCLDMITKNVFSKIDPIFWFDINTFYESMFGSINDDIYCSMINSWCSSERSFGISGRCFSFVCEADADISEDKKKKKIKKQLEEINRAEQLETIYLLEQIFPWLTNNEEIENVKKGIKACKMLKIKDEMYNERLKKLEYDFAQIGKYNKGILG